MGSKASASSGIEEPAKKDQHKGQTKDQAKTSQDDEKPTKRADNGQQEDGEILRRSIREEKGRLAELLRNREFSADDYIRRMNELEKRIASLTEPFEEAGAQEPKEPKVQPAAEAPQPHAPQAQAPVPTKTPPQPRTATQLSTAVQQEAVSREEKAQPRPRQAPQAVETEAPAPAAEAELGAEAPQVPYEFTKWSIVACGEGAGRIASLYYGRWKNNAISDRVLLFNTAEADMKKVFLTLGTQIPRDRADEIRSRRAFKIGNFPYGAGNDWMNGEKAAREDPLIADYIRGMGTEATDVLLGIATLGGGTGCGSLPVIMRSLDKWNIRVNDFALAVWPFGYEAPQRHYNAVCGLTNLLALEGAPELVIIVDNTRLEEDFKEMSDVAKHYHINEKIVKVIDMMIAPGTSGSDKTIDIKDYTVWASKFRGARHFVPCLSLDMNPSIFKGFNVKDPKSFTASLAAILDITLGNSYAHIDPATALFVFFIIRVPDTQRDRYPPNDVERSFSEWAEARLPKRLSGYTSVVYDQDKTDSIDVLLLLGGFDLKPFLEPSLVKYGMIREMLGNDELLDMLDERRSEYLDANAKLQKRRSDLSSPQETRTTPSDAEQGHGQEEKQEKEKGKRAPKPQPQPKPQADKEHSGTTGEGGPTRPTGPGRSSGPAEPSRAAGSSAPTEQREANTPQSRRAS